MIQLPCKVGRVTSYFLVNGENSNCVNFLHRIPEISEMFLSINKNLVMINVPKLFQKLI